MRERGQASTLMVRHVPSSRCRIEIDVAEVAPIQRVPQRLSACPPRTIPDPFVERVAGRPSTSERLDPGAFETPQSFGQQCGRHARHSAADLVEMAATEQQFARSGSSTARRAPPSPLATGAELAVSAIVQHPSSISANAAAAINPVHRPTAAQFDL